MASDGFEIAWPVQGAPGCEGDHFAVAVAHDEAPVVVMKCACERDDFVMAQLHQCMAMVSFIKANYWEAVAVALQSRGEIH